MVNLRVGLGVELADALRDVGRTQPWWFRMLRQLAKNIPDYVATRPGEAPSSAAIAALAQDGINY